MESSKFNNLGPIATSYSDLQSIEYLHRAVSLYEKEEVSTGKFSQTVFCCIEIVLFNIADLGSRLNNNLISNNLEESSIKAEWILSFANIGSKLTRLISTQHLTKGFIRYVEFEKSNALKRYLDVFLELDGNINLKYNNEKLNTIIATSGYSNSNIRLINNYRNARYLIDNFVPKLIACKINIKDESYSYSKFVGEEYLFKAVFKLKLDGDTFFTQFRGLHQIPELIVLFINNVIEEVIEYLNEHKWRNVQTSLSRIGYFSSVILECLTPLINLLTLNDYHKIRENLGMTSGSHSKEIHYSLFKKEYGKLLEAFLQNRNKLDDEFLKDLIEKSIIDISLFINDWREAHLQLPINNIGGAMAKSLIGSLDAIKTARRMKEIGANKDPYANVINLDKLGLTVPKEFNLLKKDDSFLVRLTKITGHITKLSFTNVQNRTGYFK